MFKYLPHTPADIDQMLADLKVTSFEQLVPQINPSLRLKKPYQLLPRLSESQLRQTMQSHGGQVLKSFRGFGAYEHERPSVIDALASRQEFLTSYTPYQPEVAQGTLQYIFEYQSMMTDLTGMDVSNASMYDGSTALAEAMIMCVQQTGHRKILVDPYLLPQVEKVLTTYAHFRQVELIPLPGKDGIIDRKRLVELSEQNYAALIISYPNRFGIIDLFSDLSEFIHHKGGLLITYADPLYLSIFKNPRQMGADIVCGEAQSLGLPLSYGGPYLGYLTTTSTFLRRMPGRICGLSNDVDQKRAFVLTLQAREQHIRREKANSNICSNQSLLALQVTIFLASLGPNGLKAMALNSLKAAHYLKNALLESGLFKEKYPGKVTTGEFALSFKHSAKKLNEALLKKGYLGGQPLTDKEIVFYASDMKTKAEIDEFVNIIQEVSL